MSLRPEPGEEEAREESDLDLHHHLEAGVEAQGASSNASSDSDFVRDDLDLENGVPAHDEQVISQEEEIKSVESLQETRTQDASAQLVEATQSADGTSSIADDTPSLQVNPQWPTLLALTHTARNPFSPHPQVVPILFVHQGPVLPPPPLDDRLIDVSSPVSRHHR